MVIVVLDEWSAPSNGKQSGENSSVRLRRIRKGNLGCEQEIADAYDAFLEIRNNLNWGSFLEQTKEYVKKFKFLKLFNARRVYCQYCQRLTDRIGDVTVNSRFKDCYVDKISSKSNTMPCCKSHTSFSCDRCRERYILKRKEAKSKCKCCKRYDYDARPCNCANDGRDDEMWNMQFKRWWGWNVGRKKNRYEQNRRDCLCRCSTPTRAVRSRTDPWDAYDMSEEYKKPRGMYGPPCCQQVYKPRCGWTSCFTGCFTPRRVYRPYRPCYCPPDKQLGRRDMQMADKHLYQSWVKESSSNSSHSLYPARDKRAPCPCPCRPKGSSVEYLSCRIESVTANLNGAYECCCCCPCRTEYKTACCQTNHNEKSTSQAAQTHRQCCQCCRKKCTRCKPVCGQSAPYAKLSGAQAKATNTSAEQKAASNNTSAEMERKTASNNTSAENVSHDPSESTETAKATKTTKAPKKSNNTDSSKTTKSKPKAKKKTNSAPKSDVNNVYFGHVKTSPLFLDTIFSSPLTGRKYSISPKTRRAINNCGAKKQSARLNDLEEICPPFLDLETRPDKVLKLRKSGVKPYSIEEFFDLQSRESLPKLQSKDLSRINLPEFLRTNSLLGKCGLRDLDNVIENLKQANECQQDFREPETSTLVCNIMGKSDQIKTDDVLGGTSKIIPPPPDFETSDHSTVTHYDVNYCIECRIPEAESRNNSDSSNFMNVDDVNRLRASRRNEINDTTNLIELHSTGTSTVDLSSSVTFLNELDLPVSGACDDLKPLPKIGKIHRSLADLFRRNRKRIFKSTKNDSRDSAEMNCCATTRKK